MKIKGKAAVAIQNTRADQRLLDNAARANAGEGIRQGLDDAKKGNTRPASEFFEHFEAERGLRS